MKVPGYCTSCRRPGTVNASAQSLAFAACGISSVIEGVCDECSAPKPRRRNMVDTKNTRYAVVSNARTRREVEAYLPANYAVLTDHIANPFSDDRVRLNVVIAGEDDCGWTLDGYVIPRLASGLMHCREYRTRHDAEDAACAAMN